MVGPRNWWGLEVVGGSRGVRSRGGRGLGVVGLGMWSRSDGSQGGSGSQGIVGSRVGGGTGVVGSKGGGSLGVVGV